MAAREVRKAPWVFCPGAEVCAKDARGRLFLANFELAETIVYDGQTVYTGYYVRRGVDGRVVFVSVGRLQSLHLNCSGCPEQNTRMVSYDVFWGSVLSTLLSSAVFLYTPSFFLFGICVRCIL
ncbi:hypothetical protein BDN70DRAFT_902346 [Pholiota conissans]|uniref:Uncharacterized protein n=1 Tax=Pholiota conissans TaxID=109636 RepID=A0A9P6CRK6_9AGAR|nr:hypothetical protein BDN70DRAFT_902346 [Pholiota conissans]